MKVNSTKERNMAKEHLNFLMVPSTKDISERIISRDMDS